MKKHKIAFPLDRSPITFMISIFSIWTWIIFWLKTTMLWFHTDIEYFWIKKKSICSDFFFFCFHSCINNIDMQRLVLSSVRIPHQRNKWAKSLTFYLLRRDCSNHRSSNTVYIINWLFFPSKIVALCQHRKFST